MRDDTGKLPMPRSARRYLNLRSPAGTSAPGKFNAYTKMVADLVNGGQTRGFKNRDAVGPVKSAARSVIERQIS